MSCLCSTLYMNTYEGIGTKRVVKQCARNLPVTWFLTAMEKPLYRQLSTCAATSNKACKFPYYLRVCSNIQFSGIRLHSGVLELFNTEYFRNSPGISEVSFKIFAPVVVSRAPTDATRRDPLTVVSWCRSSLPTRNGSDESRPRRPCSARVLYTHRNNIA